MLYVDCYHVSASLVTEHTFRLAHSVVLDLLCLVPLSIILLTPWRIPPLYREWKSSMYCLPTATPLTQWPNPTYKHSNLLHVCS